MLQFCENVLCVCYNTIQHTTQRMLLSQTPRSVLQDWTGLEPYTQIRLDRLLTQRSANPSKFASILNLDELSPTSTTTPHLYLPDLHLPTTSESSSRKGPLLYRTALDTTTTLPISRRHLELIRVLLSI